MARKAERQAEGKTTRPWFKKKRFVIPLVLVVLALLGQFTGGGEEQQEAAPAVTATQEPAAEPTQDGDPAPQETTQAPAPPPTQEHPADVDEKLLDALGDRLLSTDAEGSNTLVKFKLADNLSSGLIATGAKNDTIEILRAAREARPEAGVTVSGSFPMKDQYGNTEDKQILLLNYTPETLARMNLGDDGVLPDQVWGLAEASPQMIHPELQQ